MIRSLGLGLLVGCLLAPPALACGDGEVVLFGCQTLDTTHDLSDNGIAVCGGEPDADGRYTTIHYEFTTTRSVELSYPVNPAEGRSQLFFHHYFEGGLYRARLRFKNGDYSYKIFFDANAPSTEPDEVTGPTAGVEVRKGSKLVAEISCGERPASYFDDIRQATSCDTTNPYGEKACASDGPEVK
ncbi:hypothetical protein [Aestuariivirga sp.]|uniref:hypothetical protein n=1 Tax=Aestuariivirga sp. TaxID=2650926 RepID=UPI003594151C